jgi:cation diffusion facilitator family transporter
MDTGEVKDKTLIRSSWVSTVGNAILAVVKVVVGVVSGSLAVLGDGIDSTTDVIISAVMIFTAKIMNRPPDKKYVYGYEKAETIATKVLSLVIFYAGIQMFVSSIKSIFSDEVRELPGITAIYVTVFSIAGKLGLSWYQRRQGERINSSLLIANAKNMQNDVLISLGVLLGLFFTFILKLPMLDAVTGLLISLFILKTAFGIFMDSNVELMDGVKDVTVYNRIFKAVEEVEGASNPHRVRSRQVGNRYLIDLDVEADGSISLCEAHAIAQAVEENIKRHVEHVYDIFVHVEPKDAHHSEEKFGIDERMISDVDA